MLGQLTLAGKRARDPGDGPAHDAGDENIDDERNDEQFRGADGKLRLHAFNSAVSFLQGEGALVGGKADDYRSQPAGDAGDRIACAVIERAGE